LAEHLLCKERVRSSSLLVSTTACRPPHTRCHAASRRNRIDPGRAPGRSPTGPSCPCRRSRSRRHVPSLGHPPGPLIRALDPVEATDQRTAGDRDRTSGRASSRKGAHLNNWICVSAVNRNLRFRRVVKERSRFPRQTTTAWSEAEGGQATHGTGWMPWRQEPMKDVAGCEKLRGVASRR
jgi:hypothetical protein